MKKFHYYYKEGYCSIVEATKLQQDMCRGGGAYKPAYDLWAKGKMQIVFRENNKTKNFPSYQWFKSFALKGTPEQPLCEEVYNPSTDSIVKIKSNGCCAVCQNPLKGEVNIDHRYPKFVFPKDTFNILNWQFTHPNCNETKGTNFADEIAKECNLVIKELEEM